MRKIGIIVIIVAAVVIGIWFFLDTPEKSYYFKNESLQKVIEERTKEEVFMVIDTGEGNSSDYKTEFEEGMTVFDLLKKGTSELNLSLKAEAYEDMGIFIEAIGEKENGQDRKYWMYYINDQMPLVAADKYEIKPGDEVEFKFEKSPF